jgi:hypothetical protein
MLTHIENMSDKPTPGSVVKFEEDDIHPSALSFLKHSSSSMFTQAGKYEDA